MIGRTVSHYRITRQLGQGGMGVVYEAHDLKLGRTVALKFLPPDLTDHPEAKARFVREARTISALDHPNVCSIFEIDETDDGRLFIAMARYEGETLKQRIARGSLPLAQVVDITGQVLQGLAQAHAQGIVHRDIKPANVFVTTDGLVKILDFGLAKLAGLTRRTRTGTVLGTVAYMSPEQARGEEVDHRTDLWSLGVVVFEMLTGRVPFVGGHEQAVIYSILNRDPVSISESRPETAHTWQQLVDRALAKDPRDRFPSATVMESSFREISTGDESARTQPIAESDPVEASVAVLPFQDMSPGQDQDYFCEGIAEELINALARIEDLKVAARTSAFQYKGSGHDVRRIGRELEVRTVLEGGVRKAGDRLRITAQLVDVASGYHLWSAKFDRDLDDIFAIQDEISLAIVDKLKIKLLGQEKSRLMKRHTADRVAHNLYLKGLYFWNRRLEGGMKKAMDYFRQAIERDPGYALAHVGMADTYNITGLFGFSPPREAFTRAKAAARKTLEIDDSIGEAHASLAFSTAFFDWDWSTAEREFRRAIELNPGYATAHEWYAIYLWAVGRFDESIEQAERARELDPLSLIINTLAGIAYYMARRYEESIAQIKRALEMDPNFLLAATYIVLPYVECGMYDDAIDIMRRAEPLAAEHTYTLGYFGGVYGRAGLEDEASRILVRMDELARKRYVSALHRANLLVGMGRYDEALTDMERAYEERCPINSFSKMIPYFDCLQSNPRFQALLKKIGF
jgi:serine/threonine-protein kinase